MEPWVQTLLAVFAGVFASSGFWAWVMSFRERKSARTQMLIGLGHDKIIHLCSTYIQRGWLTDDEYDNLVNWLYEPYLKMKGNGRAKKLMEQVEKLPVHITQANPAGNVSPSSQPQNSARRRKAVS